MLRPVIFAVFGILPALAFPVSARDRLHLPQLLQELVIPQDEAGQYQDREPVPQPGEYDLAIDQSQVAIAPSEAASIAQDMVPGARVVGVKLLPNGYYAVTLRGKGRVTRVFVSATDGSVR